MRQYHELLLEVLNNGIDRRDRTGTGTRSVFGYHMRFDLSKGFPLVTTKKIHTKSVIHELLWFLSGSTNVQELQKRGVRIWDEWATTEQLARFGRTDGNMGPIYGHQWRNFGSHMIPGTQDYAIGGVDQISWVINEIKNNPESRRLIVTGWNPKEQDLVALPPCHTMFQFYVANGRLSCQLYQRSGDAFLGVPFNIASYALLTHMIAHVCGLGVGEFIHTFGDVHIYQNHFEQVKTQLSRSFRDLPTLVLNGQVKDIFEFTFNDILLNGYHPYDAIYAPVTV